MDKALIAAGCHTHRVTSDGGHTTDFSFFGDRIIYPCTIPKDSVFALPSSTLAFSGTDFWTLTLGVLRSGAPVVIATLTTETIALTAATPRTATHAAFNLLPGDILVGSFQVTGAPLALPICSFYFPSPATT